MVSPKQPALTYSLFFSCFRFTFLTTSTLPSSFIVTLHSFSFSNLAIFTKSLDSVSTLLQYALSPSPGSLLNVGVGAAGLLNHFSTSVLCLIFSAITSSKIALVMIRSHKSSYLCNSPSLVRFNGILTRFCFILVSKRHLDYAVQTS